MIEDNKQDTPKFKDNESSSYKILIVEDDAVSVYLMKEILEEIPLTIIHKSNGEEASSFVNQYSNKIHLIIMDILLPLKDGISAIAEIKNNYPHIPIIAISADSNQENKTNSYKAGCDIFIEKPLDIPKFKTAICDFLNVNV